MAKRLQPTPGQPAREFFQETAASYTGGRLSGSDSMVAVLRAVIPHINRDVCMSWEQREAMRTDIARARVGLKKALESCSGLEDLPHRLVVLANSYRLDCAACLREKCDMRDPKKPFDQVLEGVEITDRNVDTLSLPEIARTALKRVGIEKIGELCDKTVEELLASKLVGRKSIGHIQRALAPLGLHLKGEEVVRKS